MARVSRLQRERARMLRRAATDPEQKLWSQIRRRQIGGLRFRRQHPLGDYIVDFVCLERRVIIELDGGQHTLQRNYDDERTAWLNAHGYVVLRFWICEVYEDLDEILEVIHRECLKRSPRYVPLEHCVSGKCKRCYRRSVFALPRERAGFSRITRPPRILGVAKLSIGCC